jgi:hypothetical protein
MYRVGRRIIPGLCKGQLRLPPVFPNSREAPARYKGHGGAPPSSHRRWRRSGIGSDQALGGDLTASARPSPVRRVAPGSSPGAPVRRQARGAAPRRSPASVRRSASVGQRRKPSARRAERASRAHQRTRGLAIRRGPLGVDQTVWDAASAARALAKAATAAGRNRPPGGAGSDQMAKVTGPMRRGFAQVTGLTIAGSAPGTRCPASSPAGTRCRSEHTYGGPPGRRCCTLLLYSVFDLFEFGC